MDIKTAFIDVIVKYRISAKSDDYDYEYDPDHKKKPEGGGWGKTEEGWSKKKDVKKKEQTSVDRQVKRFEIPDGLKYKKFEEFELGKDKNYKYHVHFNKQVMKKIFDKGHFSVVSAGPNEDEKDKDIAPEFFMKRHEQLKKDLEKNKIAFTECIGHYQGGKENSILIPHDYFIIESKDKTFMVHHKEGKQEEYDKIVDLGKKYKQDSVLHGRKNKFSLHFTRGKHLDEECTDKGWKEVPLAKDFYTELKLTKDKISKVSMNITKCFEEGYL